jgi:4'-phosphopantetheinyl transferase
MAVASSAHSIGVDLESWASNTLRPALVARFFSPAEQATLNALKPEEYIKHFVALWVLKEAYIKARGMGLSIPLHEFTVAVRQQSAADGGLQAVLESTSPDDCVDLWHLELAEILGQHALALCARRTHANQGLTVKHCSAQHLVYGIGV